MYFYLIYLACIAYCFPPYKKYPRLASNILCVARENQERFTFIYNERIVEQFFQYCVLRPKIFFNLENEIRKGKRVLFKKYGKKFSLNNLRKLKNDELLKIYNDIFYFLRCLFYINNFVWLIDLYDSEFLQNKFLHVGINPEDFLLLTMPGRRNYLWEEKMAFLKLCFKYFKNRNEINLNKLLNAHLEKFAYTGISYYNESAKKRRDYLKQINKFIKERRNSRYFQGVLHKEQEKISSQLRTRDKIYGKIREPFLRKAILISREAAYLKEYYRGSLSEVLYYYFNTLLKELAIRLKIKESHIRCLTDDELTKLFIGKQINWKDISERQRYYAAGAFNHKLIIYYGKKARELEFKYFQQGKKESSELRGTPAQKGITRGRAKIILSHEDFKKFKENDILIASNTMPEYMPIIKKAKAMVTELGGITCHAATVSRELNKPCIIGVKNATSILKDGDFVEVDANKGVVRILKNSN